MTGAEILNFIRPEILIVIPVLIILGLMLKGTNKIPDWTIPIILGGAGIVLAILILGYQDGFEGPIILSGIIQGILAAGMAVYVHQLTIQTKVKRVTDENNNENIKEEYSKVNFNTETQRKTQSAMKRLYGEPKEDNNEY